MKRLSFGLLLLYCAIGASAQSSKKEEKNVIVSDAVRSFTFARGNTANPVQVKEESRRTYFCNSYRTDHPVAEFYNDVNRIDDIDILVDQSKKHGIIPAHNYFGSEGIFYSDARICHFKLPLVKKGSTSVVSFKKTVLDPHYFTSIHFMDREPIQKQEIQIVVPTWMDVELKEFNFENYEIKKTVSKGADETVYTYTMSNLPGLVREDYAPGLTYYAPHLLVMCKKASTKDGNFTYFNTLKDQYAWYRKLVLEIGNEEAMVKAKANEVTQGLTGDLDKVKAIYQWVQDNIRYIAFEDGIAGFKPEKAQEVLRKKYGDCKGMANLVTEMLKSIGLDARRCWIGTRHLAYDYSTPSLAVDNHMISVWMQAGKPLYLDATEKFIGMGELAERIQGRSTLIEDGNNFIVGKVPVVDHSQNTAWEKRKLIIDGASLKGHINQSWKGENKEWLLSSLNSVKQDKKDVALQRYLSEGKNNFGISSLKVSNLANYNTDLEVEYDINWKNVLSEFGDETYVELDNRRNMENLRIDTTDRTLPFWFYFKNHLVFETEISLPAGKKAGELPGNLNIKRPGYSFTGHYVATSAAVTYRCEIILNQSELKPEQFSQWNKDIDQLKNFYNQQIVLSKIK